jgi:hypothetical protein
MTNFLNLILICALCLALASGFVTPAQKHQRKTTLNLFENEKQRAAGVIAAVFLAANVANVAPAVASASLDVGPSRVLVAARSGGRMGGRSAGRSYSSPRSTYRSSTTIVRPMISSPPIIVPFGGGFGYGGYGYGYNPLGGFGLGYGLGAMNQAGNAITDYRQESEIARSKAELEVAKQREAELEARVKALEEQNKGDQAKEQVQQ